MTNWDYIRADDSEAEKQFDELKGALYVLDHLLPEKQFADGLAISEQAFGVKMPEQGFLEDKTDDELVKVPAKLLKEILKPYRDLAS